MIPIDSIRDHRRDLWVGVVQGRIAEAGEIDIGAACDHADYALSRFDARFPVGIASPMGGVIYGGTCPPAAPGC